MNNLSAFLNPVKEENVKYIASKRFLDEEGKPIYWEIKPITSTGDIPDIGQLTLGDGISDNVKKIADSDIINRDTDQLELLRGLAERTYYDKTIEIKVAMTNNNSINSALDLDGIMGSLVGGLEEQLAVAAEGGHI